MALAALTVFLSAFLLFLVQPIIAKQILPWFGGSAAVWTTCMVFFQTVLLAGYAYADWLVRRPSARLQAGLHAGLAALSLAALPIVPSMALRPADADHPAGRILLLLALTIGLPYFVLSTTGPLVQAWFARAYPSARVYRLYALSNVGSMLALAAYPFLIEPRSTARWQSMGWSMGYAAFVLLILGFAWASLRDTAASANGGTMGGATGPATPFPGAAAASHASNAAAASAASAVPLARPRVREQALWLLLAALGSTLLLVVTAHVTQNVASVPFLWVLPLSLYLLSFILCFDGRGWYWRRTYAVAAMAAGALLLAGLTWRLDAGGVPEKGLMPIAQALPLYCLGLFAGCMWCHGELAARKPPAAHLTRFYLMVSAGGAAGGVLVGIVAPLVLSWTWELPAALLLLAVLATLLSERAVLRVVGLAASAAAVAAFWVHARALSADTLLMTRDFYGTLRVRSNGVSDPDQRSLRLLHGTILHGEQYLAPRWRGLPTTYYGPTSGVGRAITALREIRPGPQRVGLIGMGTATLAAYGRTGDTYRFYELDPKVPAIARSHFSYLADTPARVELALGDARLSLEREPPQRLDLLAVDAFSSDSIPAHLMTREALGTYLRHLAPGGAIAFHVSNRYLELAPVVRELADGAGLRTARVQDLPAADALHYKSDWVVVTGDAALADRLLAQPGVTQAPRRPELRGWTDDWNNLYQVLR